jgi:phage terminase large subunit-like protein
MADAVDTIRVRHRSGDISSLTFKTYEQGRERWQGETLGGVWFDEEPPEDIYTEGLTRTNATGGLVYITFTPLLGVSNVVRRFYIDRLPGTHITQMAIEDAEHFTPEQRAAIIASYPEFEREARTKGIPQLGSGRVFPISEGQIACESFPIPGHWPRINGLDFGYDHPSAAVQLAWDRDSDIVYVINAYRERLQTPVMFAPAVRPWGPYPWSWPHDGLQHDKGSGEQLASQYRKEGLQMLSVRATYEDGTSGVEAGIMEMLDRMQTGRLKVFIHLRQWFEEFNLYHRKEGIIVKEAEDLMSATRYALMMKRMAQIKAAAKRQYLPNAAPQPQGWMG